jgi:hypothetical protein
VRFSDRFPVGHGGTVDVVVGFCDPGSAVEAGNVKNLCGRVAIGEVDVLGSNHRPMGFFCP